LGQEVVAGEVLLRLDSDTQQYALREEREKLAALDPELAALQAQRRASRKLVRTSPRPRRPRPKNPVRALREAEATARYARLNWSASRNFAPSG
jgi:multidrug resistance efflux pump